MTRFLQVLSKRNDLLLAFLLVCIVFMMILPLPVVIIDILIAINLSLSAILLMVAIYLKDVTQLSAFPSILLITTLFRLALAISTTRLILLQANAGHIVETFGKFVVGGNLIVGIVIFLILTIVNFMVITKGSERVAEVSARFSLDAMPGKQMSIDSDMRAGQIEMDEAKRRRNKLEKESQLYGAMDGAMKFVKGDAIAGLIIIAVNMIGGIAIGTMQRGMAAGDAAHLYTLLTIGDGLIQQIPALFVSITAGFIVTRVASEENDNLGSDIASQLVSEPKALMITSAIMLIFAVIPGFPALVFLGLAVVTGGGGFLAMRMAKSAAQPQRSGEMPALAAALAPQGKAPSLPDDDDGLPVEPVNFALTVPLIVDIAASVRNSIRPDKLDREVARVRRALYFDLGVPFPGINLRLNENLKDGEYRILVNEIPVAAGASRPGWFIVRETETNLRMFNVPFERGEDFLPNTPSLWVQMKHLPLLEKAGIQTMTLSNMLTFHLAHILKAHAAEFIGVQETMFLMNQMQKNFGELVREATRLLPVTTITDVLQRLVSEEISIRDMRTILEALVTWGQREKDPIVLSEHVRGALSRYITHKFSGGQNVIPAFLLSKEIEDAVRGAVRQTSGASYLALSPDIHREMITAMKQVVGTPGGRAMSPVILTPMDIRRFMRKIVERDFPSLAVLSYQELSPSANIQPLERIKLGHAGAQLTAA
ncbi:type III secretion system export apparatus subunit SctV [Aureimonas jatrophae]|uniref:Type III secretion protein V n=1 Tax=Aureimonas jatrophae TaxID=1166073 RepID=A0A1H0ERZ4_9HYPH|nr:type III secretion system export apparatus subunit SctV [Aureimonas jatrophae]MBB3950341.1 type III secretion protein V [Aureimonas jatrophae]SDN85237.1 type III secretion protein V [Aureimonas jatrophae]